MHIKCTVSEGAMGWRGGLEGLQTMKILIGHDEKF